MSYPADDHRPEGSDDLPSDGTSTPSKDWRNEPAPGTTPDPAPYGTGDRGFAEPDQADPFATGGYGAQPGYAAQPGYEAQPYGPGQQGRYPDPQYGDPAYGNPAYGDPAGAPSYGNPTYGNPYGAYGAYGYDVQPYAAPGYGAQPYGVPGYGAVQPYGQPTPAVRKDPAVMLVASLIIPGLGTILNGETGKGIGILAGYIIGALLSVILIGLPIMFGFWVWGMVDAYSGAKNHNARHGLP